MRNASSLQQTNSTLVNPKQYVLGMKSITSCYLWQKTNIAILHLVWGQNLIIGVWPIFTNSQFKIFWHKSLNFIISDIFIISHILSFWKEEWEWFKTPKVKCTKDYPRMWSLFKNGIDWCMKYKILKAGWDISRRLQI